MFLFVSSRVLVVRESSHFILTFTLKRPLHTIQHELMFSEPPRGRAKGGNCPRASRSKGPRMS